MLDALSELTIKVAGSFIKLDASGITMVGPSIRSNSGGSPGRGTAAAPVLPGLVKAADTDQAGSLLVPAQHKALMQKKPICAICEAAKQAAKEDRVDAVS